jgi:hypothetical protein
MTMTRRLGPASRLTRDFTHLLVAVATVVAASLAPIREAAAHHSFAMYDTEKLFVIRGTVKEFQWTNPHALLWITGSTDGGADELWTIELPTSPGNLARMGWTKHSLAQGDAVSVEINPLRDGSHGGSFKKATLAKSGAVLVATATGDPYAGDASAVGAAAAGAGTSNSGGEVRPAGAARTGCALSPSPDRSGAGAVSWLVLASIASSLRRRRRR